MTSPAKQMFFKALTGLHVRILRWSGGKVATMGDNLLLLTTRGRKTGQPRTTPVMKLDHGDGYLLAASYGGDDEDPQWFKNLQAHPDVEIEIGGKKRKMRARIASPEERPKLYERFTSFSSQFASYQKKTSRPIPVVILEPQPL